MRFISASFVTGLRLIKFDSGTSPSAVLTFKLSKVDKNRSSSGNLTRISISSSELSTRMVSNKIPRVTSCTIAPTVATSAPYRPAFSTSTSICQSIPGNGLVSSTCIKPSVWLNIARILAVVLSKSLQFSPLSLKCTGFGLAGPLSNSKISISIPGRTLSAFDNSAIILFPSKSGFPLLFSQGIVSSWICPIVSLGAVAPAVF